MRDTYIHRDTGVHHKPIKTQNQKPSAIRRTLVRYFYKNAQTKHYRKPPPQILLNSFCIGNLLLSMGLSEVWLVYLVKLHWRKLKFPLQVAVSWKQLLGQGREFISTFPFRARAPSGSCRPCTCCHVFWELICVSVLLYVEALIFFVSSMPTDSCNLSA